MSLGALPHLQLFPPAPQGSITSVARRRLGRWAAFGLLGLGVALVGCDDAAEMASDAAVDAATDAEVDRPRLEVCDEAQRAERAAAPSANAWLSVWGAADDAVYVVGGSTTSGAALRYDGENLQPVALPEGAALWWVWGADAEHVWAVGEAGRILRLAPAPADEPSALDDRAILFGIWGSGPDDLWAVGGANERGGPKGIVLRSTGDGGWRRVLDPVLPIEDPDDPLVGLNLYKVWGRSAHDVTLVGEGGAIVHWDGARFTRQDLAPPAVLFTVAGDAPRRFAVGGLSAGSLATDGVDGWGRPPATALPALNGVAVEASGAAWITGDRGFIGRFEPEPSGAPAATLTGRWCRQTPDPAEAGHIYHAVWAGPSRTWFVGGDLANRVEGRVRVTAPLAGVEP